MSTVIDMSLGNKIAKVADFAEKLKNFVVEQLRPDMTLETIKEVVTPLFDDVIKKQEASGLKYGNGRFGVNYVDEQHFQFEFEMYFKDAQDKWHECTSESDLRDATLLEKNTWTTIKTLKVVMFPIEPPEK